MLPYRFLEEVSTADVAFEAWGETREELFISSAEALLGTMVDDPQRVQRRQELIIRLEEEEFDLLLFVFLQELIFYKDARRLLLHAETVEIEELKGVFRLEAVIRGEEIDPQQHRLLVDVKAVTLHGFQVKSEDNVWKAVVVLDV
jgi:SHS2 domain-containing protein